MALKNLLLALFLFCNVIIAEPVNTGHAEVSLVKSSQVNSDSKLHAGIKMDMQSGWHTYWINPGDSGGALKATWDIPKGNSVSEVKFPKPHKIPYPPLMTFGYENEVIFPIEIDLKDANKDIPISVTIDFLICADVCIPESAFIKTSLNKIPTSPELFKWREQLPSIALPNLSSIKDDKLQLRFSYNKDVENIYFFPKDENVFIYEIEQNFYQEENNWVLEIPLIESVDKNITGVLVINDEPFLIDADLSNELDFDNSNLESITIWQALLFAFIGGLILNVMPCVFPIISLKALSFVSMGGGSSNKVRLHAINFCFGVILSFISIALIIILLQKTGSMVGWGFQLQSPIIVATLSILMFLIGLILLMDINIGMSLTRLGSVGANDSTYTSSFLTGVLAVIVASPCTAPFMGAAIGYALIQPSSTTVPVFLSLGIGFSLPYLMLALFPDLISKMPKPGEWMNTLKEFFAFPMFATALWLLWVFSLQTSVDSLISLLITILILSILFWMISKISSGKIKFIIFIGGFILIFSQLNFIKMEVDSLKNTDSQNASEWSIDIENEFKELNQAYLINYTAAWCITCQANDKLALSRPDVKSYLESNNIKYIVADWTNRDDEILKVLKSYGRTGVPLYLYWKPGLDDTKILPAVLTEELLISLL